VSRTATAKPEPCCCATANTARRVFLHVELPANGAYELATLPHQHPQLQQMRLIALTDRGDHPAREHARAAAGFERYIVKPY
jgi:CheY-like chemotaxis protein